MSKWCDTCYRNEITKEWKSCDSDCPVFGKHFEELAKIVIKHEVDIFKGGNYAQRIKEGNC